MSAFTRKSKSYPPNLEHFGGLFLSNWAAIIISCTFFSWNLFFGPRAFFVTTFENFRQKCRLFIENRRVIPQTWNSAGPLPEQLEHVCVSWFLSFQDIPFNRFLCASPLVLGPWTPGSLPFHLFDSYPILWFLLGACVSALFGYDMGPGRVGLTLNNFSHLGVVLTLNPKP